MNFAQPAFIWILAAAVPLLVWFLWWAHRRRVQLAARFIAARLLDALTVGVSRRRQVWRGILLVLAAVLVLIALARPQWGFDWEEAKQTGLDILVAIDTSRSMLAGDVAPSRLERAKLEALSLMGRAKTDRLGLIAFAGTSFLQCPLTLDDEAFRQSVLALDTEIIPQGGTALGEAIQTAQDAFKDSGENFRVLVLLTDGEDHEEGAVAVAKDAAALGMRIFTIGLGTPDGELLRVRDETGAETFVKDNAGNVVKSRLNEQLLQGIATVANGFYLNLRGAGTMDTLYEQGLSKLPKREFSSKLVKRLHEKFQWPLGLAVLLLVIEMFIPERSRKTGVVRRSVFHVEPELGSMAVFLLCLSAIPAAASEASAHRNYETGRFDAAAKEYQALASKKPDNTRLSYNAGAAAHQAGQFDDAAALLQRAMTSTDRALQQRALYNLGNTRYRQGEQAEKFEEKQPQWEEALKAYEAALQMDPQDADAKFNEEFVKRKLEELKQQKERQEQQQQKQDQSKDQQKQEQKPEDQKRDKGDQQKSGQQQQQDPQQAGSERKQPQEKKDQQSKNEQQKQEQAKDSSEPQPKAGGRDDPKAQAQDQRGKPDDQEKQQGAAARMALGQMTPEQAQQLLEAHKGEERTLLFKLQAPTNGPGRILKNW